MCCLFFWGGLVRGIWKNNPSSITFTQVERSFLEEKLKHCIVSGKKWCHIHPAHDIWLSWGSVFLYHVGLIILLMTPPPHDLNYRKQLWTKSSFRGSVWPAWSILELGAKSVSVRGHATTRLHLQIKSVLVVVSQLWMNAKPLFTLEPMSGIPGVTAGHRLTHFHRR